ncbi:glutamine amidotransferase-related protein [Streptomyces sp. GC420]|uniref:type 1 glutamine amidotransferase n=1 Tax=Streptomyces sp. GC420 TaxID=2697568 RepID=UPI00141500FB|nr:gamma-glutamyl-gamma-aminobutyrate hydrolase family protein [Streptomyces sp. GC420]NBM16948.1 aminotransferase [Streptomyces sp. GC420]
MRALVIRHEHVTRPGEVGARLAEHGYDLTVLTVVPEDRHHTPDVSFDFPDAGDWDLITVFGAPWSVYDDTAVGGWIGGELALLRKAHHLGVPVLGVCFGAQALSAALGGGVEPAPRPEIGWYGVDTDDPGLITPGPWFQWHHDRCVLPPGAVEVARGAVGPQAFRVGRSLGVQFHPEASPALVRGFLANGGEADCLRNGVDPRGLLARTRDLEQAARSAARHLVDGFLDRVAGTRPGPVPGPVPGPGAGAGTGDG